MVWCDKSGHGLPFEVHQIPNKVIMFDALEKQNKNDEEF
jgi:hypothetical protein